MNDVVLDASALLAVLRCEQGAEEVEARIEGASIGTVNLAEVVSKLADEGVPEGQIRRAVGQLELNVQPFEEEDAFTAGLLRRSTRRLGLSLGDRACLALAQRSKAVALTADRAWSQLDLGIPVETIR